VFLFLFWLNNLFKFIRSPINKIATGVKSTFLYFFILLIFSCKEKRAKTISRELTVQSGDSTAASAQSDQSKMLYIERSHLDLENFSMSIQSKFDIPDSLKYDSSFYFEGIFLFMHEKKNNHSDSLRLEIDDYDPSDLAIGNFSDSLHFKTLLLCISWRGDSDQPGSEFVEYDGDTLKHLFTVNNLVSLQRKDKWTLSGFVAGRDEVVSSFESDYPLTVSLKDYETKITDPDRQAIGYSTVALADIKAYRAPTLYGKSTYLIKKGTKLIVDSIYRSLKLVRLIVSDSIILYGRPDKISENVQGNAAG